MKIEQETRIGINNKQPDQKNIGAKASTFTSLVETQRQKMQYNQLQDMLVEIDHAGERLVRSRTFKDLAKYKTMVKKFMKETVDFGMNLKQSHSWNQFGEGRKLKLVETIDQHLVDLTDEFLKKDKPSIDLLGKVGEIKGLLINLYT
ncbi:YaaR family protein [Heyndrickxia acidicola]|uniref:YaaR family protein n=1 Tax=Heyndrickxia acidicola TaxID=209389 RepID=A0ABU6MMV8_9BACI|nr:YaaR family protein [Heyndrickxia acidicola]MED1206029.1 YaaR family protein [Heyndrickxia acidicola]